MSAVALTVMCRKCEKGLPLAAENSGQLMDCPNCGDPFRIDLFPCITQQLKSDLPQTLTEDSQATCFYHEQFQAKVACDGCGRFLCGLCDVEFQGGHQCVNCIQKMQSEEDPMLVKTELRWVYIVLAILLMSIPLWFIGFITVPLALFFLFKHGRQKKAVFPSSKLEFGFALFMGLVAMGFVGFIYFGILFVSFS